MGTLIDDCESKQGGGGWSEARAKLRGFLRELSPVHGHPIQCAEIRERTPLCSSVISVVKIIHERATVG